MQRFENKYDLLNAVYQDTQLKKSAVTLFQYLVHKSNREQCFPSVETIAKALNVCKRTVQYNMRKLEAAGYIIRKDRYYNHQQLSNQYIFNFGVVEDGTSGVQRYSETVKEYMADEMGVCESSDDIRKAQVLHKIYGLQYSSREKLLLIYLYHKANNKGLVYANEQEVMDAIGVGLQTFYKLLSALCRRGLLKVKYMIFSGKRLLIAKLVDAFVQHVEEEACDRKEIIRNIVQNIQKKDNDTGSVEGVQNSTGLFRWVGNAIKRCCQSICSIRDKVRKVLRI